MIQKLATNMPPMLVEFNDVLKLSMYTLNKVGDSIPPCFTPLDTQKEEETMFPHLTHICWCEYQYTSNLIINKGTSFDINF